MSRSPLFKISLFVAFLHMALLFPYFFSSTQSISQPSKMIIQTKTFKTPPKKIEKKQKPTTATPVASKQKKAPPTPKPVKKIEKKPQTSTKKTTSSLDLDGLIVPTLSTQSEKKTTSPSIFSIDEILVYLQQQITLPNRGEIKALLNLSAQGKIMKVEILKGEDPENTDYLIKTLSDFIIPIEKPLPSDQELTINFKGI